MLFWMLIVTIALLGSLIFSQLPEELGGKRMKLMAITVILTVFVTIVYSATTVLHT